MVFLVGEKGANADWGYTIIKNAFKNFEANLLSSSESDVKTRIEPRHSFGANFLYLDGHASARRFSDTIGDGTEDRNSHFVKEWCTSYQEPHDHAH